MRKIRLTRLVYQPKTKTKKKRKQAAERCEVNSNPLQECPRAGRFRSTLSLHTTRMRSRAKVSGGWMVLRLKLPKTKHQWEGATEAWALRSRVIKENWSLQPVSPMKHVKQRSSHEHCDLLLPTKRVGHKLVRQRAGHFLGSYEGHLAGPVGGSAPMQGSAPPKWTRKEARWCVKSSRECSWNDTRSPTPQVTHWCMASMRGLQCQQPVKTLWASESSTPTHHGILLLNMSTTPLDPRWQLERTRFSMFLRTDSRVFVWLRS